MNQTLESMQSDKRGTGRTSRMIDHAIELANQGRAVYIICKNPSQLMGLLNELSPNSGIKCEGVLPANFDWKSLRVPGAHPNCAWLFDHYWIESQFSFQCMFDEMVRYDKPSLANDKSD